MADEFKKKIIKDPKLGAGGNNNNGYKAYCNCCGIEHHSRYAGRYRKLYRRRARRSLKQNTDSAPENE